MKFRTAITQLSSDPPPTTTPIDNPDALFTPEPHRPSNVNVITQDSDNVTQQLDFSSTPRQEACNTFQPHQHYYREDWLYNHNETESSPALLEPSTVAHVPTPTNHSPIIVELLAKKMNRAAYGRQSSLENKWDRQVF